MNIAEIENTPEKSMYPPRYLEDIRDAYEQHHKALQKLAGTSPTQNKVDDDNVDLIEYRLLKSQEHLLKLATNMRPSNLHEIDQLLKLWRQVAIEDVSQVDISLSDELILTVCKFFENRIDK